MKTVTAFFDGRFDGEIDWHSIPGLDDLSPGTGEARRAARDASLKLALLAVRAFKDNGLKVLAIEFGVVSKGPSGDASLYTSFVASKRYSGIFVPKAGSAVGQPNSDSVYVRAMRRMASDVPEGSDGPEAIVTHPALQDPNLDCVFVIPDNLDSQCVSDISDALNGQKLRNYVQSDRMTPIKLRKPKDYKSRVEDRIARFREIFLEELGSSSRSQSQQDEILLNEKFEELNNAIVGIIPLFRSDYYDNTQLISNNKIANIFATDVAGVVQIVWAVPDVEARDDGPLDQRLVRAGRSMADLFSAVALRDVNTIATQAHRAISAVRTAYHDIYNLISKYTSRMSAKRLFFDSKGAQRKELFKFKVQRRTGEELDEELGEIENSLAAQALDDFAFVRRMRSQAAILEVQWGGTSVRAKFQGLKQELHQTFTIDELVKGAFEEVRDIEPIGQELEMAPAVLSLRKHSSWLRPKEDFKVDQGYQFVFPRTYVSYDIIVSQIFEIFLNARKYALPNPDGNAGISVEVSGEYVDGDLDHPRCVVKIRNEATPSERRSKKDCMLSLINGINVEDGPKFSADGRCFYEVKIVFGPVLSEVEGADDILSYPALKIEH